MSNWVQQKCVLPKIRMVVKGDTLIYNADAFQLAEGSMLDGLIKFAPWLSTARWTNHR